MLVHLRSLTKKRENVTSVASYLRCKSTFLEKEELMKYLSTPPYTLPNRSKIVAPPMVYIAGEEMTHYTMKLM